MKKQRIRLSEAQLNDIVKETVRTVLNEDTKKQRQKDPMNQWFKDMEDVSKYRETMDFINNGGRNPNKRTNKTKNKSLNEGVSDDNPIEKWIYWCYNYDEPKKWMGLFKGAPAEHFMKKFENLHGGMNRFYLELDRNNRPILIDYVMNNY